ncbi:SpoIIE family protein phosphatase [Streptomyces lomondensis]|uniref:SpoIIE family protein phosphatase n=1 Tax=Streptomyces lomondensis TaxID=68229 RepID=UPI00227D80BD|nr:SpoIIE family protein phosphatase [Streptomyces lomondensis]
MSTHARYSVTTASLLPGTTLALYTDGLVEIPGIDATRTTSDLARHLEAGSSTTRPPPDSTPTTSPCCSCAPAPPRTVRPDRDARPGPAAPRRAA